MEARSVATLTRRCSQSKGFSLIDLALMMAIIGILLAGFLATYKVYQATRAVTITENNARAVQEALGAFIALGDNRYPRPARFGLIDGDEGYGLEAQDADIVDNCTNTTSVRKLCRGDGVGGEKVFVGVVPFADLNMPAEQARDGYGRLFTYAVAEKLTLADGNDTANFHVCVKSQDIDDTGAVSLSDCTLAADNIPTAMALVSHGRDGLGGWTTAGRAFTACATVGSGSQNENCNFDGTFIQAARRAPDGTRQPAIMQGEGAARNDDILKTEIREDSNFWAQNPGDKIANRYNYKVGIGIANPQAALDVDGNIKADKLLAKNLCLDGSTTCLQTQAIAGSKAEMECSALGMVKAVQNNEVECQYLTATNTTCTATQYISGFDSNGNPICTELPASCGTAHGQEAVTQPTTDLCTSGTASAVSGTGPWTWTCTLGAEVANCATVEATGGCLDECGDTKREGARWCVRGASKGLRECKNGLIVDYGCLSGKGCCLNNTICQ